MPADDIAREGQAATASRRPRRDRRSVFALGIVAALALVTAGVLLADQGDPRRAPTTDTPAARHHVAVERESLQPPGTMLDEGVAVQPGSSLVGAVFPVIDPVPVDLGGAAGPVGWQAVLLVEGDPVEVWDSYVDAFGTGATAGAVDACVVEQIPREDHRFETPRSRFLTEEAMEVEDRLVCTVRLGGVAMYLVVGSMACSGSGDRCTPRLASHLHLRITDGRLPGDPAADVLGTAGLRAERAQATSGGPVPYTIPRGPIVAPRLDGSRAESRLPGAGDRLDDGLDSFLGAAGEPGLGPAVLPDGARSLIAPAILLDCSGGLVAVTEVPGEPVDAIGSLDPGAADRVEAAWMRNGTSDGVSWAAFRFDAVGGYRLMTTAIAAGDDASIVLATECGD